MTPEERQARRLVLGFLLAPLAVSPILLGLPIAANLPAETDLGELDFLISIFFIPMLFAYITMLFLGVPAYNLLFRRRLVSLWWFVICGSGLALAPVLVLLPNMLGDFIDSPVEKWKAPSLFFATGAITGAIFWLIARPDRQPIN